MRKHDFYQSNQRALLYELLHESTQKEHGDTPTFHSLPSVC